MEKKVFRVGSVGIGGISRGVHLPGIHKSPDLELVAVCDLKPERMEYARNTYGIREDHCFADYHDLIACPDVDVIDISTSNNAHFEVAKAAIEAGNRFAWRTCHLNSGGGRHFGQSRTGKRDSQYGVLFLPL